MSGRRFTDKPELNPADVWGLDPKHPAMIENRTLFPSTVVEVTRDKPDRLLVSGHNNRKLGATVEKGRFKGYALYGLSLEERATCPTYCAGAIHAVCGRGGLRRVVKIAGRKCTRKTCSRSCAVYLSWGTNAEKRAASIRAARRSPEQAERQRQINYERWSRPGERERLSERNRERWRDPHTKIELSVAIAKAQTKERRQAFGDSVRKRWQDPKKKAQMIESQKRSKTTPKYKARQRASLKARWKDPAKRQRIIDGMKRVHGAPDRRETSSKRAKERWLDPEFAKTTTAAIRSGVKARDERKAAGKKDGTL